MLKMIAVVCLLERLSLIDAGDLIKAECYRRAAGTLHDRAVFRAACNYGANTTARSRCIEQCNATGVGVYARMTVFGGVTALNWRGSNDTYTLNVETATWIKVATSEPPTASLDGGGLSRASAVKWHTPEGAPMMTLFAGFPDYGVMVPSLSGRYPAVRTLNLRSNMWIPVIATGGVNRPRNRDGHTAVTWQDVTNADPMMTIFGGHWGDFYSDVYTLNLLTSGWIPVTVLGPSPAARTGHTAVVRRDADNEQVMTIFGGKASNTTVLHDVHNFNLRTSTWTEVAISGNAPGRVGHTAILWRDSTDTPLMTIYAGIDDRLDYVETVWTLNLLTAKWTQLATHGTTSSQAQPGRRTGHSAMFWLAPGAGNESLAPTMTVFGGHFGGARFADVWSLNLLNGGWTPLVTTGISPSARTGCSTIVWRDAIGACTLGCAAYYEIAVNNSFCTTPGTWGDGTEDTQAQCKKCPHGTWSDVTNLVSQDQCEGRCSKGKWSNDRGLGSDVVCAGRCSAGKWSDGVGLTSDAQCKPCPRGRYSGAEGLQSEEQCAGMCDSGTFSNQTGLVKPDACTACPVDHVASAGSSNCDVCGLGHVPDARKISCVGCQAGEFKHVTTNASTCVSCPNSSVAMPLSTTCTACKPGEIADATHATCTMCPDGLYSVHCSDVRPCSVAETASNRKATRACRTCPTGATCRSGTLVFDIDTWYNAPASAILDDALETHTCFNEECCEQYDLRSRVKCNTHQGYYGPLCGACDRDHGAMRSGRGCTFCPKPWEIHLSFAVLVLAFVAFIVYLVAQHDFDVPMGVYSAAIQRLGISHVQMLGVLGVFRAKGTKVFNEAISRPSEVVGGSFASLLPVKCLLGSQIYGPFFLNMFMPFIVLVISCVIMVPKMLIERKLRYDRRDQPPPVFKGKLNLPRCVARCKILRASMTKKDVDAWRAPFRPLSRLAGITVFTLFTLFPTLVSSIASIFNCTNDIGGKRYLVADLTVICFEGDHIPVFLFACACFALYAFGIPAAVATATALKTPVICRRKPRCVCSRRSHAKYATIDVRTRFGFLFAGYSTDRSGFVVAWESWVMLRKLAVTLAGSTVSDPYMQILFALLILVISGFLTAYVQPYEFAMLNLLDVAGLFVLIVTQILSIVYFYVESSERPFMDPNELEILVTTLLFLLNVVVIVFFIIAFGVESLALRDKWSKMRCFGGGMRVVKVVTDPAVVDLNLQLDRSADGFWWHHPSGVAVRNRPERSHRADGTPSRDWNWHDENAGSGVSTETPELLQEVEDVESLEVDDGYHWMHTVSHKLTSVENKFADVGGTPCCWEARTPTDVPVQDVPHAEPALQQHRSRETINPLEALALAPPPRNSRFQRGFRKMRWKVRTAMARQRPTRTRDGDDDGFEMPETGAV